MITPDDIDLTLTGKQQILKLLIGAFVGFYATKLSDKSFDHVVFLQRVKEVANNA